MFTLWTCSCFPLGLEGTFVFYLFPTFWWGTFIMLKIKVIYLKFSWWGFFYRTLSINDCSGKFFFKTENEKKFVTLLPCLRIASSNPWYSWAAIEIASSCVLQTKPWHSSFRGNPLLRMMQAKMDGCSGMRPYFVASIFDRGLKRRLFKWSPENEEFYVD